MAKKNTNYEMVKLDDLIPFEGNIRKHTELQVEEMRRSIEMFGQFRPIVIDENNVVLVGHGLLMGMQKAGKKEAECLRYTSLSEDDKKKLMIADNRIFELGITDADAMMELLESMDDYNVPGFEEDLLMSMLGDAERISDAIETYGVLDEEGRERLVSDAERVEARIEAALSAGDQAGDQSEAGGTGGTGEITETGAYVMCPHCGEQIWLS